ncbi:putative outer membrane protein [Photobacterium marinum]|uniref:Putative outer membrane protein n=1 Tax=Photobacterium marinum TaxID=1056511 RepID=L8JBV1_9GAMM|nr:outer membrane beta-barrel protein [Photobacterium marinum]ELR66281.1 putative outer membrane protein [Photobacterium marinum]
MKLITPAIALAATLLPLTSFAQPYVGFGVGQSQFGDVTTKFTNKLNDQSVTLDGDLDESSVTGSIYAGYQFNPYFAVEFTAGGMDAIEKSVDGVGFSAGHMMYLAAAPKASLPIGDFVNIYGKWGLAIFNADVEAVYGPLSYSDDNSSWGGIVSLGAEFIMNKQTSLRVSWDYLRPEFEIDSAVGKATFETDINMFMVGLNYKY